MAAEIKYPAAHIDVDGMPFRAELSADWQNALLADANLRAAAGEQPGVVEGRLSRSGRDIVVRGKVTTKIEADCVRCLSPAKMRINANLSLLLVPAVRAGAKGRRADRSEGGEYEFDAREADVDSYDGETVVLDAFIREALILATPSFPLCRRDCPGMPAAVAQPDGPLAQIDPRLAPLSAFREKEGAVTLDDIVEAAAARAAAIGSKPILKSNARRGSRKNGKKKG